MFFPLSYEKVPVRGELDNPESWMSRTRMNRVKMSGVK